MGWSGCTTPFDRLEDRFDPAAEEPMQSSVLDRELEREREPTGAAHPLPAVRLVATQRRPLVLYLRS
jgi:hypothetical protein